MKSNSAIALIIGCLIFSGCSQSKRPPIDLSPVDGILEVISENTESDHHRSNDKLGDIEMAPTEWIEIRVISPAEYSGDEYKAFRFKGEKDQEIYWTNVGTRFEFTMFRQALEEERK
ncbi:hypothetical protein F7C95_04445 [Opitutia bacterium ISCC 51]|nr:hypothetical protein F7C95_04445 [Opitutae bacterium ISCC 51]QXD29227.1 hypothetical protein GA003_04425 [Opitutae bacterium ISCC 52]